VDRRRDFGRPVEDRLEGQGRTVDYLEAAASVNYSTGVVNARHSSVLDEVERGETPIIDRHGRRAARLVPKARKNRRAVAAWLTADSLPGRRCSMRIARRRGLSVYEAALSRIDSLPLATQDTRLQMAAAADAGQRSPDQDADGEPVRLPRIELIVAVDY